MDGVQVKIRSHDPASSCSESQLEACQPKRPAWSAVLAGGAPRPDGALRAEADGRRTDDEPQMVPVPTRPTRASLRSESARRDASSQRSAKVCQEPTDTQSSASGLEAEDEHETDRRRKWRHELGFLYQPAATLTTHANRSSNTPI